MQPSLGNPYSLYAYPSEGNLGIRITFGADMQQDITPALSSWHVEKSGSSYDCISSVWSGTDILLLVFNLAYSLGYQEVFFDFVDNPLVQLDGGIYPDHWSELVAASP